jgi:hypothetical protein
MECVIVIIRVAIADYKKRISHDYGMVLVIVWKKNAN